uniref:hypothetical protein n=1 Tax=Zhouia sp. PK063 TaxID=3373602 RepID=UPI0037DC1570
MKNDYHAQVIKLLALKYGISVRYVRYCIRGERNPEFAERLLNDYRALLSKLEEILTVNGYK